MPWPHNQFVVDVGAYFFVIMLPFYLQNQSGDFSLPIEFFQMLRSHKRHFMSTLKSKTQGKKQHLNNSSEIKKENGKISVISF